MHSTHFKTVRKPVQITLRVNPGFILFAVVIQIGNAVRTDDSQSQWVDLGDLSGVTCFANPDTCAPAGATVSLWVKILNCPTYHGILTANARVDHTGLRVQCKSNGGLRWVFEDLR